MCYRRHRFNLNITVFGDQLEFLGKKNDLNYTIQIIVQYFFKKQYRAGVTAGVEPK